MSEGELAAVFKGLAEDAGEAGEEIADSIAKFADDTANIEDANVARTLAADAETARAAAAIGKEADLDSGTPEDSGTAENAGENARPSNRVRPPRDGDTNYVVDNPHDLSDTITDIDRGGFRCTIRTWRDHRR